MNAALRVVAGTNFGVAQRAAAVAAAQLFQSAHDQFERLIRSELQQWLIDCDHYDLHGSSSDLSTSSVIAGHNVAAKKSKVKTKVIPPANPFLPSC
jgi:hypothetical protein